MTCSEPKRRDGVCQPEAWFFTVEANRPVESDVFSVSVIWEIIPIEIVLGTVLRTFQEPA